MNVKKIALIPTVDNKKMSLATSQMLNDIGKFSSEIGFKIIQLPFKNPISIVKFLGKINDILADFVLFPYPTLINPFSKSKLAYTLSKTVLSIAKKSNLLLYVYDLPFEQIKSTYPEEYHHLVNLRGLKLEKELFDSAHKLLVFNEFMVEHISKKYNIPKDRFIRFEILDMYTDFIPQIKIEDKIEISTIVYAANLDYSRVDGIEKLIAELPENVKLILIGPNGQWLKKYINNLNVIYNGLITGKKYFEELSKADFGVIWYPKKFQNYLRFGATSKFSSYIVSGLPTLVCQKGYVSDLVKKYKIGIIRKNLDKITSPNTEKYLNMQKNVINLSKKIRSGYFIKQAIIKAIEK